jgi:N-formylglutamate amidohydrolase
MELNDLLVVIPHSGIVIPAEISPTSLSPEFPRLMRNVDWYTNWLYDFRDILDNSQIQFPYCSLILEANRDPLNLDSSVPLRDALNEPLYKSGQEPEPPKRKALSEKYLTPFHQRIEQEIARGKTFMLDAHSTVSSRGVEDNQIELMNYQTTDKETSYFCPDVFIEIYAEELTLRLPGIKVTINKSRYDKVYGHVCGRHSINSSTRQGGKVPAILQETNHQLYLNTDGTPNVEAMETLRRAYAESLYRMMERVGV